ncbi:hypothetical protein N665_0435s0003 [Sinapis alba]|nr:hypothetical protein N665_0435s0003 [Sinapis alba]
MDLPELLKRLFTLGEEPERVKSILYHTDDTKLFTANRGALDPDEYQELRDSTLGVFLKFKELKFSWASRLVHFMLYFKLDIKKKCEVTEETIAFWQLLGVGIDAGPTTEQIIATCKRCSEWSRDDRMRLGYLAIFTGFIEGRKFSTVTRASLARLVMDLEEFENYPWGESCSRCGCTMLCQNSELSMVIPYKTNRLHLCWLTMVAKDADLLKMPSKDRRLTRRLNCKSSVSRLSFCDVMNFLKKKDINEIWPKWDHNVEDKAADHIVEVMWNGNHHWTMEWWEVAGTTLGSNQKFVVMYAKNEEGYVKEETTVKEERPRKKARKEITVKAEESPREVEESPREAEEALVG